jgi:hypothetical protein
VFAVGERNEEMFYAGTIFTTSASQELSLQLAVTAQEAFHQAIERMGLPDLTIKVAETKTGIELRKVIKELKNVSQLKPVNCNCDCLLARPEL